MMKLTALVAMLVLFVVILCGCDATADLHKSGNRITGGKDVQTYEMVIAEMRERIRYL